MAQLYRTREGDTADFIVWKHYGRQDVRLVEKLIDANPTLADQGAVLPDGLLITLPDFELPQQTTTVRLWD